MDFIKHSTVFLSLALLAFSGGCASTPSFPGVGGEALHSKTEFGVLTATPDVYQGRAIKLAGRIVGVETTEHGTLLLADWLPYPSDQSQGPVQVASNPLDQFELFFPGVIDDEGMVSGNQFLVIGKIAEPSTLTRRAKFTSSDLPHITAQCLQVWKTGSGDLDPAPDVEFAGYPLTKQTYCSKI